MNKYLLLVIIFILYFILLNCKEIIENYNNSLFKDMYIETTKFFPLDKCIKYKNNFYTSNLITDNPLDDNFNGSKGFVIEFDSNNSLEIFKQNNIEFMYDFFQQVRKSYATDFILNVLIIPSKKTKNRNNYLLPTSKSVDYHYDTTIEYNEKYKGKYFDFSLVPECVSVLYIDLPEEFSNGELLLYGYGGIIPIGKITPEIGKLVEFNGILLHAVNDIFISNESNNENRISIVLEQYTIK